MSKNTINDFIVFVLALIIGLILFLITVGGWFLFQVLMTLKMFVFVFLIMSISTILISLITFLFFAYLIKKQL